MQDGAEGHLHAEFEKAAVQAVVEQLRNVPAGGEVENSKAVVGHEWQAFAAPVVALPLAVAQVLSVLYPWLLYVEPERVTCVPFRVSVHVRRHHNEVRL